MSCPVLFYSVCLSVHQPSSPNKSFCYCIIHVFPWCTCCGLIPRAHTFRGSDLCCDLSISQPSNIAFLSCHRFSSAIFFILILYIFSLTPPPLLFSGVIEAIPDTVSLDVLRKRDPQYSSLFDFYERFFGVEGTPRFTKARINFVKSLAGYCILCYLLNLKDRHNGNILLDVHGHIIHIDYGFVLSKYRHGAVRAECVSSFSITVVYSNSSLSSSSC